MIDLAALATARVALAIGSVAPDHQAGLAEGREVAAQDRFGEAARPSHEAAARGEEHQVGDVLGRSQNCLGQEVRITSSTTRVADSTPKFPRAAVRSCRMCHFSATMPAGRVVAASA